MRTLNLHHIIRFTLAIIMSMVAGYWIGATVDDDYVAATLALISIVVIAAVILAPIEKHSHKKDG
jgi:uncharacterized membrane protein